MPPLAYPADLHRSVPPAKKAVPKRAKKSGNSNQFPLQMHPYPTEVVIRVSPTSVASDKGPPIPTLGTTEPHHQPRWRHDPEAETSIPQPPSASARSFRLRLHAAARVTRPVTTISRNLIQPCWQPVIFTIEALMIIAPTGPSNNFFADFGPFLAVNRPSAQPAYRVPIPTRYGGSKPPQQPPSRHMSPSATQRGRNLAACQVGRTRLYFSFALCPARTRRSAI